MLVLWILAIISTSCASECPCTYMSIFFFTSQATASCQLGIKIDRFNVHMIIEKSHGSHTLLQTSPGLKSPALIRMYANKVPVVSADVHGGGRLHEKPPKRLSGC